MTSIQFMSATEKDFPSSKRTENIVAKAKTP